MKNQPYWRENYYEGEDAKDESYPESIRGYDWFQAFAYANAPRVIVESSEGTGKAFDREDVAEVIASVSGIQDERDWLGVFRLKDGRFVSLHAGCDYTGWDCQAGGDAYTADNRADIIRYGRTNEERERLGLSLPEGQS